MSSSATPELFRRLVPITLGLFGFLLAAIAAGLSIGSSGVDPAALIHAVFGGSTAGDPQITIIREIRLPRVLLAGLVGAALSLGGMSFQALLRNPLAEPYILGISGGAAIGAILGILLGFSRFPGVSILAFAGSMGTLLVLVVMSSGQTLIKRDALLLCGVMVNAFCSAVIMFLVSMTQDSRLHSIIFWLMGDFSLIDMGEIGILACLLVPAFILLFLLSNAMNLLLLGRDMASALGINIRIVTFLLLTATTFMVSATVSFSGLVGFVGLVVPHLLRLMVGTDHRVLAPACILGGGAFLIVCDLLARTLPDQGEMPVGVITAMIGAPLFIYLLRRTKT